MYSVDVPVSSTRALCAACVYDKRWLFIHDCITLVVVWRSSGLTVLCLSMLQTRQHCLPMLLGVLQMLRVLRGAALSLELAHIFCWLLNCTQIFFVFVRLRKLARSCDGKYQECYFPIQRFRKHSLGGGHANLKRPVSLFGFDMSQGFSRHCQLTFLRRVLRLLRRQLPMPCISNCDSSCCGKNLHKTQSYMHMENVHIDQSNPARRLLREYRASLPAGPMCVKTWKDLISFGWVGVSVCVCACLVQLFTWVEDN